MRTLSFVFALMMSSFLSVRGASLFVMEDTSSVGGKISGTTNGAGLLTVNGGAKAYLFFDLSELDAARPLRSARLRLYFVGVTERGGGIGVHAVSGAWAEGNTATVNAPQHATKASAVISAEDVAPKSFASVDVTALVGGWLRDAKSNNGMALVPVPLVRGQKLTSCTVASKEGIGNGIPAMLDVEFGETDAELAARFKPKIFTPAAAKGSVLSVGASTSVGELRYQWYRDGVAVSGATQATYDATGIPGSYRVRAGNGIGYVESSAVVVKSIGEVNQGRMVMVRGGVFPETSEFDGRVVRDFWMGKYEVTWGEWKAVRAWSVGKGYDLADVGEGGGDDHPVTGVSWYDVVKWSNARSEKEGLEAVYRVGGSVYRIGEITPTVSAVAKGYRLPLEKEWEWAARGGVSSKGYTYSGSNDLDEVGWYGENSGNATHPVGSKKGNELGLYDMSGNVPEWCWDQWNSNSMLCRRLRGGSWTGFALGSSGLVHVVVTFSGLHPLPGNRDGNYGFRLARSSGQ